MATDHKPFLLLFPSSHTLDDAQQSQRAEKKPKCCASHAVPNTGKTFNNWDNGDGEKIRIWYECPLNTN